MRGTCSKRSLLVTYQLVVFCNHSLQMLLDGESTCVSTDDRLAVKVPMSGNFLSMTTVRELGSEDVEGEVCTREDHLPC